MRTNARFVSLRNWFPVIVPCSRGKYSVICGGDFRSFPRRWQLTAVRGKRVHGERVVNECPRCFLESITRLSRNRYREMITLFQRIISFLFFFLKVFLLRKTREGSIVFEIRDTNNYIFSIKICTNIFQDFVKYSRNIYTRSLIRSSCYIQFSFFDVKIGKHL